MKKAILVRELHCDEGTFGRLVVDGIGFECATAELPYRDVNEDGISDTSMSCVPTGEYTFRRWKSAKRGDVYRMSDEDEARIGRFFILIHSANVAGDTTKGYATQLEGCIAPGADVVTFLKGTKLGGKSLERDQRGVSSSRFITRALEQSLNYQPFKLTIENLFEEVK